MCLLAVLLLWVPAWAAAFQAERMACCADGMCPAHGHAAKKSSQDSDTQNHARPGACELHGVKVGMECTMACCHPEAPMVAGVVIFILPAIATLAVSPVVIEATLQPSISSDSSMPDPASPPPRS